ncbi:hypothetical protein L6R53_04315 [Myxococcota bacterium]|nr:hypothetical protein [Myxococcota bacterium]
MGPIPGLPGASQPSFRTGRRGWVGLDQVVHEVVAWLAADGVELSPYVVKVAIQVTRRRLDGASELAGAELFAVVQVDLRSARVVLPLDRVEQVVRAWASVVALLDIRDTRELAP